MSIARSPAQAPLGRHPYGAEIEAERQAWYEIVGLLRSLMPEERVEPGYQRDPDWAVRDVVAHIGTWLAEAQMQLERISAGTYEGHDIDAGELDARLLAAMGDQPWTVAWVQANAGRTRMLHEWSRLDAPSDEAARWVRRSGADHYGEHLGRLRGWVAELIERRSSAPEAGTGGARPRDQTGLLR